MSKKVKGSEELVAITQIAEQIGRNAFLETANDNSIHWVCNDHLEVSDEVLDAFSSIIENVDPDTIDSVAKSLGYIPEDSVRIPIAKKDKPKSLEKLNCGQEITVSMKGISFNKATAKDDKKRLNDSLRLMKLVLKIAHFKCSLGNCKNGNKCVYSEESFTLIEESLPTNNSVRWVATTKGKCTCPKRPKTGGSSKTNSDSVDL